MRCVKLGKTGAEVSILPLGTMKFGSVIEERVAFQLLDYYTEAGGTSIDTANIYAYWINDTNGGESETVIGRWLKARKNRSQMFIATKGGLPMGSSARENGNYGLQRDRIINNCERSLQRLGVETIDLYYAHYDNRETPLEVTMETFYQLIKTGKVRFIGASNWTAWRVEQARFISEVHNWEQFCCLQQKHSYLKPQFGVRDAGAGLPEIRALDDVLIDYWKNRELTILAHEPLLKGLYAKTDDPLVERFDYETPDNRARIKVLHEIANEANATPLQIVIAWMLRDDPMILPIIAADNKEQLEEDLGAVNMELSEEQLSQLNTAV